MSFSQYAYQKYLNDQMAAQAGMAAPPPPPPAAPPPQEPAPVYQEPAPTQNIGMGAPSSYSPPPPAPVYQEPAPTQRIGLGPAPAQPSTLAAPVPPTTALASEAYYSPSSHFVARDDSPSGLAAPVPPTTALLSESVQGPELARDRYLRGVAIDTERRLLGSAQTVSPTSDDYLTQQATQTVDQQIKDREMPWQEKIIPEPIRDSFVANAAGTAKDALGSAKDAIPTNGVTDALGGAATDLATGLIQAAQIPSQRVNEVQITRRYDEITKGDPDATFGPWLPSTLLTTNVINPVTKGVQALTEAPGVPGEVNSIEPWLNDPNNEELIKALWDNGFEGEQGYGAVYKYWDAQQGMGSVLSSALRDPFTYASLGVGAGKSVASNLAAREGALGVAGKALGVGIEATDAVLLDPLKIPGYGMKAVDTGLERLGLPTVKGVGGKIYDNVLLTDAGRQQKALNVAEEGAHSVNAALGDVPVDPWLFERDASGMLMTDPSTPKVAPLVRDRVTGAVRPVRAADMQDALEIMARMPHERDVRLAGGRTSLQRMQDDWVWLASLPRHTTGLPKMLETTYPRSGPLYRDYTQMVAKRIQRYGQEAIDAQYEDAAQQFTKGMRDYDRLNAIPVARRPADWADQVRRARDRANRAAYQADMVDAATDIAGRVDAKASIRRREVEQWRKQARFMGGYSSRVPYMAKITAGAAAPAGGTPSRLTWQDLAGTVDDDTRRWGDTVLSDGRLQGDVVAQVRSDLDRLSELSRQAVEATSTGKALSSWDAQELDALVKQYAHLFPKSDVDAIANLKPNQMTMRVGEEVKRQIGIDGGMIDPKTGQAVRTGLAASDSLMGKVVRGYDALGSQYRKYQLYNPFNIFKYTGMQGLSNGLTLGLADAGATLDYAKAIVARAKSRGRDVASTPFDQLTRDAGLGPSPFVKAIGNKDDLADRAFKGSAADRFLMRGREFAGAFDTSLREAAYMHRFQPRYRALQMAQASMAAKRAAEMGAGIGPGVVEQAIRDLDALHTYRAWSPEELKQSLLRASGRPGDVNVQNWADRVARDYANGVRQLHKDALANVNRLGFSFEETKPDALLGKIFMYHYWSSRANMLYTREMLGNPALLNGYVNLWKTMDREAEKDNAPSWLRGMYSFMQTPLGLTVFTNGPVALLNTFAIFNPEILGDDFNANLTGLGQMRKRSPFMINPFLDLLGTAAGVYGSGAQAPNLNPISFARTYDLLTWWNAHTENPLWTDGKGNPVPPPYPLRDLGGREVAQMVAEKISPLVAPSLNRLGIPADIMQYGDTASTQQQDITYLMADVIREQHPGMAEPDVQSILADNMFDPSSPIYQEAQDRYASRLTAGMPTDQPIAAWLIGQAAPVQILPRVTSRNETEAQISGYFDRDRDRNTWTDISNGLTEQPVRIGGYSVAPPSLFTEVDLGGTVVTPEQLAAMTPIERLDVANKWFEARHGMAGDAEDPFPEDAFALSNIAKSSGPADLKLQRAYDKSFEPGTPEQNATRNYADAIQDATITDTVEIAGSVFDADTLADLTSEERKTLSKAWLIENDLQDYSQGYYDAKDALITENPDVGGQFAMKDVAAAYPGGSLKWVQDTIKANPNTYGQYAARLDPNRYPEGSEDWVKEMLSLEAYQTLTGQRPSITSPIAWGEAPPPVIPGLTGASSLADKYAQDKAAKDAEWDAKGGGYVQQTLDRMGQVKAAADAYDASVGYTPGTSYGKLMQQVITGDTKNKAYFVDSALYDQLQDQFSGTTEDGYSYGPMPGKDSKAREYILWALQQPQDKRNLDAYWAYSNLEDYAQQRADGATVVTDPVTGQTSLQVPESAVTTVDPLAGLALTTAADGSGTSLTTQPVAPQQVYSSQLGATLYEGASGSTRALIDIPPGTPLTVISEQNGYVLVQTPWGMQGYISKMMAAKSK